MHDYIQEYVNGGFQTVVRVLSGDRNPLPPFHLNLTSFLTQLYLILTSILPLFNLNLTSASSGISSHGLETTVYRPLVYVLDGDFCTTTSPACCTPLGDQIETCFQSSPCRKRREAKADRQESDQNVNKMVTKR